MSYLFLDFFFFKYFQTVVDLGQLKLESETIGIR